MYCYDPPMRLEDAWAPVDEIAGTGVDTFVYGSGDGPTFLHNTQVGEIWGTRLDNFSQADQPSVLWGLASWRAYENMKSLMDRGLDPMNVLIDRAHDKGLDFFASLRLTHSSDPKQLAHHNNWQFRIDHPEWCIRGEGKYNFNWIHPEVPAERLAIIEETVNRFTVAGAKINERFILLWVLGCLFMCFLGFEQVRVLDEIVNRSTAASAKITERLVSCAS